MEKYISIDCFIIKKKGVYREEGTKK